MRQHIEHLAAALGLLGIALFVSYFGTHGPAGSLAHPQVQELGPVATLPGGLATTSIGVGSTTPSLTVPKISTFASTTAPKSTPTKPKTVAVSPPPITPPVLPTFSPPVAAPPAAATTSQPLPSQTAPQVTTNSSHLAQLGDALVNIICTDRNTSVHSISGSGVFIDQRGLILTVAHVAQYYLLKDYLNDGSVSCIVRTGSPARTAYDAEPVYVSRPWVEANAATLIEAAPKGTGQYDFAVLAVTKSLTSTPLPAAFPYVSVGSEEMQIGDPVSIGSYGAQFLSNEQIRNALYPTLVDSSVKDRYTFDTNSVDVLALAGSDASQEGSSGGAAIDSSGHLIGIITTSAITGATSTRALRVITPLHFKSSFEDDMGTAFTAYLSASTPQQLVAAFAVQAKNLGQIIAKAVGD